MLIAFLIDMYHLCFEILMGFDWVECLMIVRISALSCIKFLILVKLGYFFAIQGNLFICLLRMKYFVDVYLDTCNFDREGRAAKLFVLNI